MGAWPPGSRAALALAGISIVGFGAAWLAASPAGHQAALAALGDVPLLTGMGFLALDLVPSARVTAEASAQAALARFAASPAAADFAPALDRACPDPAAIARYRCVRSELLDDLARREFLRGRALPRAGIGLAVGLAALGVHLVLAVRRERQRAAMEVRDNGGARD